MCSSDLDKPLARLIKKKRRERTQINKTRDERRDVMTDNTEIQRIIRDYKNYYIPTSWITIRKEMDKFLETYNLPRLYDEETENLDRPITSKEIETVIKDLPRKKSPGPDSFIGKFYKIIKEDLIPILIILFQNIAEEGNLPNTFYKTSITLIPKPDKDTTKEEITGQYP